MANIAISELPPVSASALSDEYAVVQGGVTKKATGTQIAASFGGGGGSTAPTVTTYLSGSGNYTTPADAVWLQVKIKGGGGSGGCCTFGGGGGGEGGYVEKIIIPTALQVFAYSVGSGAAGRTNIESQVNGITGSATTFSTMTASGGLGGESSTLYGAGGLGGAASGGDINLAGCIGHPCTYTNGGLAGQGGGNGGGTATRNGAAGAGVANSGGGAGGSMNGYNNGAGGSGFITVVAHF